ncbi:ATPase, T2SS/T4P/T4SS family [Halopseudomonas salina]|uniref:Bacterial type II secretion system protein E domain-containing protein n=1 Tax=Halopseudomonas salina TaxID=1323744 RepID=A0ABQ1NTC2_9GAMM|nr:ATPase, T2SS/T4P/T4SS family [Halopseudomonas salina]GGC84373.1 hypothetical protein GCM10007418_00240 [Halopseudomonas salina]
MSTHNPKIQVVLRAVPREAFIASSDLAQHMSGHSIPTRSALQQILTALPPMGRNQSVLYVGAGSGYVPAALSHLFSRVHVVEKEAAIADIAATNLAKFHIKNVEISIADVQSGFHLDAPCDFILSGTFLKHPEALLGLLKEGGVLINLEPEEGRSPSLVQYRRREEQLERAGTLGWVDFRRSTADVLIDLGVADEQTVSKAREEALASGKPLMRILHRLVNYEDAELYRRLAAQKRNVSFIELEKLLPSLDVRLFAGFSRTFLDKHRLIPAYMEGNELVVASDDPDARLDAIERLTEGHTTRLLLVTPTDFQRLWSHLAITLRGDMLGRTHLAEVDEAEEEEGREEDAHNRISPYLVSIYEGILLEGVTNQASDIHLERYDDRIRIRLRIDGELHDLNHYRLTPGELLGIVNVIKLRAELNIAERRLPQGGRSMLRFGDASYDLRVQTQPSLHGEHVVIRLLRQTGRAMTMQELGMSRKISGHYRRLLNNPAGLVLVVGPTGSGKSTTLYAGLQELADDGQRKVITVEDPIEYSIDNIQQTRVRPDIGFSFANAMRAFVRQDPDVILVGEIRDQETALEAMRASQTGHVVLSTLHCNDAVDSLQRLYDLGVHPNSIASELLAVIAQRLAKRICKECRTEAKPDPVIMAELFPEGAPAGFRCYAGTGCPACNGKGTRGRVAVVEYLHVNQDIRNAISRQPPIGEMRWLALDAGLSTMRDSALDHVIAGTIPMSELPRILPEERMAPESRGGRREAQ